MILMICSTILKEEIMPKIKTGDIYLIRFHPAFGAELKRFRPAVIVSEKVNQTDEHFTLIAPLTTSTKKTNKYELSIKNNTSLEKNSTLLLWYLRTIDTLRLERKLGTLNKTDITKMKQTLKNLF